MLSSSRRIPCLSIIAGALLITSCQADVGPSFTADATAGDATASDGEPSAIIGEVLTGYG